MVLFFSAENFTFILSLSCDIQNSRGNFSGLFEMRYNKYIADWLFRRVHFPYLDKQYSPACFCVIIDPEVDFIVPCSELFRGFPLRHITTCLPLHALLVKQLCKRCYVRSSTGNRNHTHGMLKTLRLLV
jgi:hypothetical protein